MGLGRRPRHSQNGAYWYSKELVETIIPSVETERPWVTINEYGRCADHAIVIVHGNAYPHVYEWLSAYRDLVLVCSWPETVRAVAHLGRAVYLPMSVDVPYVERFRRAKDRDVCYAGRFERRNGIEFPPDTVILSDVPREELLTEMARYRRCYAVDRCAIEAKVLGCEVLPYHPQFPDPDRWQVLDSHDAARRLQVILDGIDRKG